MKIQTLLAAATFILPLAARAFDDGHSTGILSWDYLHFLGHQQDKLWHDYEARLVAAGVSRDAPMTAAAKSGSGCSH